MIYTGTTVLSRIDQASQLLGAVRLVPRHVGVVPALVDEA